MKAPIAKCASGGYSKLLATIRQFNVIRGEKEFPYIQISTTLTGETLDQIEQFKQDVEGICDYYNIGYTKLNHLDVNSMNIDAEEKEKIRQLQKRETLNRKYNRICPEAFEKLSINWNGDVTICCSDYDNYLLVGNILNQNLYEIFNSKEADSFRAIISKNEYQKLPICNTCFETVPLLNA